MENSRIQEIIELIKKEVKPALGCTEPIAVSLAVARSCEARRDIDCSIDSSNFRTNNWLCGILKYINNLIKCNSNTK